MSMQLDRFLIGIVLVPILLGVLGVPLATYFAQRHDQQIYEQAQKDLMWKLY